MFLCLLLPNFRLQAALRWREISGSVAVVEEKSGLLLEVNGEAVRQGILPGQTGPQAMARDGRIVLLPPSPAQEDCLNHLLVAKALSLAPHVESTAPGIAIADLHNAARSLCWQQLAEGMVGQFRADGLALLAGVASTPDLAVLAARGARPTAVVYDASAFVAALPLQALDLPKNLHLIFQDWGIVTAGDFLKLPRGGVIERLGAEAKDLLRRVSGRHKRLLRLVRTPPEYAGAFDFEYEVETVEPLLFLLRRFLHDLTARLRESGRVACRMELDIPLDDGSRHQRTFCIPSPTADVETLFRILHTHLETLQLPQRPVGVRLKLEDTVPSGDQLRLFESALRDPNRFGETLARLKAMVGNDGVGVPVPEDTHEPDRFTLRENFPTKVATGGLPVPFHDRPGLIRQGAQICPRGGLRPAALRLPSVPSLTIRGLPLRRYRPAETGRVTLQNERPVFLAFPSATGEICHCAGPFRLSGAWWDERRWEVEEWDVALSGGAVFRIARRSGQWTVEGCYEVC